MAKGLRSSRALANRNRLRDSIYEPAEMERLERLSAAQRAIAAIPGAGPAMDVDGDAGADGNGGEGEEDSEMKDEDAMDIDSANAGSSSSKRKFLTLAQKRAARSARRKASQKPKKSIVFRTRKFAGLPAGHAASGGRRRRSNLPPAGAKTAKSA